MVLILNYANNLINHKFGFASEFGHSSFARNIGGALVESGAEFLGILEGQVYLHLFILHPPVWVNGILLADGDASGRPSFLHIMFF